MAASDTERLQRAQEFLQEAVYRSRAEQAGAGLWAAGDPGAADCGLGQRAAVVLDLSPRAEELFAELWPSPTGAFPAVELAELRAVMAAWVKRQDALDRTRNHFMKAFRQEHGFDRGAYDAERLREYEEGLEAINAQARGALREAAATLLEAGPRGPE